MTDKTEYHLQMMKTVFKRQASTQLSTKGVIEEQSIRARMKGDFPIIDPKEVDYTGFSQPDTLKAAALIPF